MKVTNYQPIIYLALYILLQINTTFAQTVDQSKILLTPAEQQWLTAHPVIKVAGGKEWAPIDFQGKNGEHQGFSHDYLEMIREKTGLVLSYDTDSWTNAYNSVLTKKNTLLPALYQSAERDKVLLFSNEYYRSLDYFFTRNDIEFDPLTPFKNKKLALVKDYALEPIIRKLYPDLKIISTESLDNAITMVLENKADLIYDSFVTIQFSLKNRAITNFIPYKIIEKAQTYPLKMATTKENPELISIINKGMAAISNDNKEALLKKWGISSTLVSPQKKSTSKLKLSPEQLAWLESHPIIKVAADTSWFPFDFVDKNGVHDGLSQDVLEYIAKKTGAKVIGTETTINILRGYGISNDQLYPVRGGEDYQFEGFSVRVIPSIHSALNNKHYLDSREYTKPPKTPLRVSDFIEGRSLMFLARFKSHKVLTMGSMNFVESELVGIHPDILLAGVNQSQLGLYNYNERLIKVTGYPKTIIPTHWDNFRLPYGFSQENSIILKLLPFKKNVEKLSTQSSVKIVRHLETIKIN